MEKLSKGKIYFIVVAAIAFLALILVITTSTITYSNAKQAIENIGVVGYSEKSKEKIDDAQYKFDQFQSTLGATTTFTSVEPFDWLIFAKTSIGFSLIAGIITLSMVIRFFSAVNVSGL